MRIKGSKRFWVRCVLVVGSFFICYLGLLCFPQPFFRNSVEAANLTLYSDRPFSPSEGQLLLKLAGDKLAASPLFNNDERHSVFVCNARWRRWLFFNRQHRVGGINYYPLTTNVFIRESQIEQNRLISPSGKLVEGDRTLDYFIAHEIAHTLTKRAAGWRHFTLPEYVREGYPDYLAKGSSFDYSEARQAFLSNVPEMDRWKSGLYLRYHLLVAHLLDRKRWSLEHLFKTPMDQDSLEDEVRKEAP